MNHTILITEENAIDLRQDTIFTIYLHYIYTHVQHSGSTLLFGCFGVSLGYSQPQSTNKLVSPFMTVHLFTHYFSDDLLVLNRPGLLVLDGMVTLPGADITTRQKDTFETMFWTFFKKQLQSKQQN